METRSSLDVAMMTTLGDYDHWPYKSHHVHGEMPGQSVLKSRSKIQDVVVTLPDRCAFKLGALRSMP